MRMPPPVTLSIWLTGTRLPRKMPLRSQTTAWMLSMSLSRSFVCPSFPLWFRLGCWFFDKKIQTFDQIVKGDEKARLDDEAGELKIFAYVIQNQDLIPISK